MATFIVLLCVLSSQATLETRIRKAISANDHQAVRQLLAPQDLSVADTSELCLFAVHLGYAPIVETLIAEGADVNYQGYRSLSALHLAIQKGHDAVFKLLLSKQANIECPSSRGERPLHVAVLQKRFEMAKTLLDQGALVDSQTKSGNTALHIAARRGDLLFTRLLLERGANALAKNKFDRTTLELAQQKSHTQVIKTLTQFKLNGSLPVLPNPQPALAEKPGPVVGVGLCVLFKTDRMKTSVKRLTAGTPVTVLEDSNGIARVQLSQTRGYVYSCMLCSKKEFNRRVITQQVPETISRFTSAAQGMLVGTRLGKRVKQPVGQAVKPKTGLWLADPLTLTPVGPGLKTAMQPNVLYVVSDQHEPIALNMLPNNKKKPKQSKKPAPAKPSTHPTLEALLPDFFITLQGSNPVRVVNPNEFEVLVGIRKGRAGCNFPVPAFGRASTAIPNGAYEIYFVYSSDTETLYQGDPFTLQNNGVEIKIVKVVDGNYHIRPVNRK